MALRKLNLSLWLFSCVVGIASAQLNPEYYAASCPSAQLNPEYYAASCPSALTTIKGAVASAVQKEPRMGASLLRLHFHDCFVQGCDASVLLNDTDSFTGEKTAFPNANSLRGFDVIDNIKSQLETSCTGVVSCADILAIAARDSGCYNPKKHRIFRFDELLMNKNCQLGGPSWRVGLGRRDSTTASLRGANSDLPAPFLDLEGLITAFANKNFTATDLVALSGAPTIGKARCTVFRSRIYNETNIDSSFATSIQVTCPSSGGDDNLSPLDTTTENLFDNAFFKNLVNKTGLWHSDQQLFNGGSTDSQVQTYISNPSKFETDFANAMIKMSNLSPLTGNDGQIRTKCYQIN